MNFTKKDLRSIWNPAPEGLGLLSYPSTPRASFILGGAAWDQFLILKTI